MSEWPDNEDQVTDIYRDAAKQKIAVLWEPIGFHEFQRGVQLLHTALQEPDDLLRARRNDLAKLLAAYQDHPRTRPAVQPVFEPA
ncbi:hypothetical protein [Streptomyces sp. NPDC088812]|uniref:hypothetical protein n=1 Tax=Streptomyces sp. NPDC088812 TaxID=3365905 RepID=UPI0038269C2C